MHLYPNEVRQRTLSVQKEVFLSPCHPFSLISYLALGPLPLVPLGPWHPQLGPVYIEPYHIWEHISPHGLPLACT